MRMNRRLLLQSAAVGVPVAVVSSVVSRAVGGLEPALAAATGTDCQSGTGRVIYWGEQHNTNVPSSSVPPYESMMPAVPKLLQSGVTAVAAAGLYVYAVKDGRVYGFGNCGCGTGVNWYGDSVWNIPPDATAGVTAIDANISNALALRDGRVIAWGSASSGIPAVPDAAKSGVTAISCGPTVALAVKDGGVIQWGGINGNMPAVPDAAKSGVVAVSVRGHAMALRADGSVVAWGPTTAGTALQVPDEAKSGVTAIAAGGGGLGAGNFSLAVKNGQVLGWGANDLGQLSAPADTDVVDIAAGMHNGMSLTKRGTVNVWSINTQGQTQIPDEICKASAIAISGYMCAAIL
jgi:hypothetical protein